MKWNLLIQLSKFGIVGVLATTLHTAILVVLVEVGHRDPTLANMFAFMCAGIVSYTGNYYWTYFSNREHVRTGWRFILVVIVAASMNYTIFALMVNQFGIHYIFALAAVILVVPLFSFTVQKHWVF